MAAPQSGLEAATDHGAEPLFPRAKNQSRSGDCGARRCPGAPIARRRHRRASRGLWGGCRGQDHRGHIAATDRCPHRDGPKGRASTRQTPGRVLCHGLRSDRALTIAVAESEAPWQPARRAAPDIYHRASAARQADPGSTGVARVPGKTARGGARATVRCEAQAPWSPARCPVACAARERSSRQRRSGDRDGNGPAGKRPTCRLSRGSLGDGPRVNPPGPDAATPHAAARRVARPGAPPRPRNRLTQARARMPGADCSGPGCGRGR